LSGENQPKIFTAKHGALIQLLIKGGLHNFNTCWKRDMWLSVLYCLY